MQSHVFGTLSTKISATNSPPRSNLNSSFGIATLLCSAHVGAAVHRQRLSGYVARFVAGEKQRRSGHFVDNTKTRERCNRNQALAQFLRPAGGHVGLDVCRRETIHTNALRCEAPCERAGERNDRAL